MDETRIKADSERIILAAGGRICDWLPVIDLPESRWQEDVIARALILNAMLNIHFKAPISVIARWITSHNLASHLAASEKQILAKTNADLTEQENANLYWYIEAVWTLMWAGGLIDSLPIDRPVEDYMATLTPNLQRGDGDEKFKSRMRLRPHEELYRMLDLYYRAHWYACDGQLNGYPTPNFNPDIMMERRKTLEWVLDPQTDWDHVRGDT